MKRALGFRLTAGHCLLQCSCFELLEERNMGCGKTQKLQRFLRAGARRCRHVIPLWLQRKGSPSSGTAHGPTQRRRSGTRGGRSDVEDDPGLTHLSMFLPLSRWVVWRGGQTRSSCHCHLATDGWHRINHRITDQRITDCFGLEGT